MSLLSFLILPVPPKVVPFSFGEESFHAGQPATLQCTVAEGDQPINIIWSKGPETVSDKHNITITKISRHLSILTIEEVAADHIGNYTCSAKNSVGTSNYTATLFVNGGSSMKILVIIHLFLCWHTPRMVFALHLWYIFTNLPPPIPGKSFKRKETFYSYLCRRC